MKIYTRTGDDGTTSLFSGGRVAKTHLRVQAYGTVDELNSVLGLVRAHRPARQTDAWLEKAQNQLFYLGADLATPLKAKSKSVVRIGPEDVTWLETMIDAMSESLPQLDAFILPGGSVAAAHIHVARTVCRRAERLAVELGRKEKIGDHIVTYLNRLSDWLFMLARWENQQAGVSEKKWSVQEPESGETE